MKFTTATEQTGKQITIVFRLDSICVSHSFNHPKDSEIKKELKASRFNVSENRGGGYNVTGGTELELRQVVEELHIAYGLVEEADDTALLSRIAIEIAYGAAKSYGRRLTSKDFPPGFDIIKAAETDGFMNACLETAWRVLKIVQ